MMMMIDRQIEDKETSTHMHTHTPLNHRTISTITSIGTYLVTIKRSTKYKLV